MATEAEAEPLNAELRPISELAASIDLDTAEVELFGRDKAKIDLAVLERLATRPNGKLISRHGGHAHEGRRRQDDDRGLPHRGPRPHRRERARLPPRAFCRADLGAKGGGTGAGRAQVVPREDINLHFTGDLHAIAAANNLLASAIDAHLLHGNELGIDPATITWRRCLDIEDRVLRRIAVGLGEDGPFPRRAASTSRPPPR